jgi:hypothetical protein
MEFWKSIQYLQQVWIYMILHYYAMVLTEKLMC